MPRRADRHHTPISGRRDANFGCRACGRNWPLERAHLIARPHVGPAMDGDLNVILLCGPTPTGCHGAFDRGELDVDHLLTPAEAANAVLLAGSLEAALRRLRPTSYRSARAAVTTQQAQGA
jgi:hypothetical protein